MSASLFIFFLILLKYTVDFRGFSDNLFDVVSMEEEQIIIVSLDNYHEYDLIYNLRWLIPLALDTDVMVPITIKEKEKGDG